jgi:FAD/FMN-containing dehydrogenase
MSIVNDVTGINPIEVLGIATPRSTKEVCRVVRETALPLSVGGGHFSMGGQTASPGTLHLDLREMNRVLDFDVEQKTILVEAGIRWCDIQRFVDPHGLAVKIMQTYANFTVGGALSVNAHGRYIGLGPVCLSVRFIRLVLATGEVRQCSASEHSELFNAAIGGYAAIGIITEVSLDLVANIRMERQSSKMPTSQYWSWFDGHVRGNAKAIFHNSDLYPPNYTRTRAVTWFETQKPATTRARLQPLRSAYLLEKYFMWAISETPFGKTRREYLVDPLLFFKKKVHWRNFEAGYDVAELEPVGRSERTYVLQEYFIPVAHAEQFTKLMTDVLSRHRVNAVNISIRHALGDPGTLMAWARGETFAFVLYHKQRTRHNARERVGVWTRELIDAALLCQGTYYLPYQPHATQQQFHKAYPRAHELFSLKRRLDPQYRLRGALWDKYYAPTLSSAESGSSASRGSGSLFHDIYDDTVQRDRFYRFLQNIFHLFPEDRLHGLIQESTRKHQDDESIYREIQSRLKDIAPSLGLVRYALPALVKQKTEMGVQTAKLLAGKHPVGYVEIGTTGRYVKALQKHAGVSGPVTLVHTVQAGHSPEDLVERGQIAPIGKFLALGDYEPIDLPAESVELVSCFVGLHHMQPERLEPFLKSIARVLRPGGHFIVRDHDVTTPQMDSFVALAHAVFNAGLGETWDTNRAEPRYFESERTWVERIEAVGFRKIGSSLLQEGDPSDNLLMAFERVV